jgi:hypothetical protein
MTSRQHDYGNHISGYSLNFMSEVRKHEIVYYKAVYLTHSDVQ